VVYCVYPMEHCTLLNTSVVAHRACKLVAAGQQFLDFAYFPTTFAPEIKKFPTLNPVKTARKSRERRERAKYREEQTRLINASARSGMAFVVV
jgi:hypothetical protein